MMHPQYTHGWVLRTHSGGRIDPGGSPNLLEYDDRTGFIGF